MILKSNRACAKSLFGKMASEKKISYEYPFCLFAWWCLNATFNNIQVISWLSVLLVEETGRAGENHRHVASH
jgi:hypothetical protein